MIFGRGHRVSRRQALVTCGLLASTALLALTAGCGGGGGDTDPNGGGGGGTTRVTLTGQVIDIYKSGQGVEGASVSYNGTTVLTDSSGNFSLDATPSSSVLRAVVIGPNLSNGQPGYHGSGTVSTLGATYYRLNTEGFPLAATTGQTDPVNVGIIRLANVDGPPPPPF